MTEREQDLFNQGNYLEHCKIRAIELSELLSKSVKIEFPDEAKVDQN